MDDYTKTQLWLARFKAFGYEAVSMLFVLTTVFVASADFQALVQEHFGGTLFGTIAVLLLQGYAKHQDNVVKAKKLGAADGTPRFYI